MYYSAGTYEAFARPEKPEGADRKSAYIIGTGLAGLSAAFYLVRDGQVKGEHIHLLEKLDLAGGSCDGRKDVRKGFYMRGGREMDNHFECMWDMFRDVPSIETPGVSVLDEYYWLNKHDPNYSLCRASEKCGQDAHTDKKFTLDKDSALALSKLFMTPEKDLEDKKISEILPDSFWDTNFWLYWQTMFAFQRWSSALEMKRYLCRYCHHIDGLPDFSALRFTKYNQYESMILPLVKYLESHGVSVEYGMDVKNVVIKDENGKKTATQIIYEKAGKPGTIDLIEDDLVFITNGCCTDTSCYGDQNTAPDLSLIKNGMTASMASNYVKHKLLPAPRKKLYSAEQLARLMFIAAVKPVVPLDGLRLMFSIQAENYEIQTAYDYFCDEFENMLGAAFGVAPAMQGIGETESDEKDLLRNTITAVVNKVYLDRYLAFYREAQDAAPSEQE